MRIKAHGVRILRLKNEDQENIIRIEALGFDGDFDALKVFKYFNRSGDLWKLAPCHDRIV